MSIEEAAQPETVRSGLESDAEGSGSEQELAEMGAPAAGGAQDPVVGLEYVVAQKLKQLSPDKQQEVLDFVEFLESKSAGKRPRRSLEGLWADQGIHITEEDIAEARREMWGNFPRDDI